MGAVRESEQELSYALRLFINHGEGTRGSFGIGVDSLLRAVREYGSLAKAAESMGMAYSKAWSILRQMEHYLGFPMIESQVGRGRGSRLTAAGEDFIRRYDLFCQEVTQFADESFKTNFHDFTSF